MNSCSVRLTFTDDEFYETFIEPRKINGDLPTLILRLLTAYAFNDSLAVEIDQYLDSQEENPSVTETRQAILNAIAHMNSINAILDSSDRALSEMENGSGVASEGFEMNFDAQVLDNQVSDSQAQPVSQAQPASQAQPVREASSEYSDVMKALGTLTGQVSILATSVSDLVSCVKAPNGVVQIVTDEGIPEITEPESSLTPDMQEQPQEQARGTDMAQIAESEPDTQEAEVQADELQDEEDVFVPDFMTSMIESVN